MSAGLCKEKEGSVYVRKGGVRSAKVFRDAELAEEREWGTEKERERESSSVYLLLD